MKGNTAAKVGEDSVRKERMMRLKPVIDQRFDGISQEAVEQDKDRQVFIYFLVNPIMESARKKELKGEIFANDGTKSLEEISM